MTPVEVSEKRDVSENAKLMLQAMRRAVRQAFLSGEAYDPDGSGKAYWEAHDELGNPITKSQPD